MIYSFSEPWPPLQWTLEGSHSPVGAQTWSWELGGEGPECSLYTPVWGRADPDTMQLWEAWSQLSLESWPMGSTSGRVGSAGSQDLSDKQLWSGQDTSRGPSEVTGPCGWGT